jgi:hypothetical protein
MTSAIAAGSGSVAVLDGEGTEVDRDDVAVG